MVYWAASKFRVGSGFGFEQSVHKKGLQMVSRNVRRCPAPLNVRGAEIKATVRYHRTPITMAKITST